MDNTVFEKWAKKSLTRVEDRKYDSPMFCMSVDDGSSSDFYLRTMLDIIGDKLSFNIPITFYLSVGHFDESNKIKQYYPILYESNYTVERINLSKQYNNPLIEIGCHGWQHRNLKEIGLDFKTGFKIWNMEIIESKAALKSIFNREINSFSFPYGEIPEHLAGIIDEWHIYKSMRGYQLQNSFKFPTLHYPDGLLSEFQDCCEYLDYIFLLSSGHNIPDIHLAGHATDLNRIPLQKLASLFDTLNKMGYKFVTVSDYYERSVPF